MHGFVIENALKEMRMKKMIIYAMIFLFAGCAWDESGRPDRRRHESDRYEIMGARQQHQDHGQSQAQGQNQGHEHAGN